MFSSSDIHIRCFLTFIVFSIFAANTLYAQDVNYSRRRIEAVERFELSEVVVTAFKIEEPILDIPKNVTVITSEDIKQAPSNNIVDLLARESGITVKSLFGHDKWAGIDIRGMGDTRSSNVIVMADGVRLNPPDMAGPDLSSIPLDQIERIEILRGSGSVLYGDGAVGGVINIITKKGQIKPETRVYSSYGSYNTSDIQTSFRGKISNFLLNANGAYYDSEGYRDNGALDKKDASMFTEYEMNDHINLSLRASIHEDTYGLPEPVDKASLDSKDLRRASSPDSQNDSGKTTDRRFIGNIEIDFDDLGLLTAQRGYRFRKNFFLGRLHPLMSKEEQTNHIDEDTRNLSLHYNTPFAIWGLEHRFQCGMEHYETEYISERLSEDRRINNKIKNLGAFLTSDWALTDEFALRLGYRQNHYKGNYRIDNHKIFGTDKSWVNGHVTSHIWSNDAYELGITYSFSNDTNMFINIGSSFRVPNTDELVEKDENLHPQKGKHLDIGGRYRITGVLEFTVTLFQIRTTDEIYYNEENKWNCNYDEKTLRKGLETDVKFYPADNLFLWCNYTYTDAKFEKKDTFIPLVPRHKATMGLEWQISYHFLFSLTGIFTGSSFDGNYSENNNYDKLGGYEVFDSKLTYEYKGLRLFAGVNNILDEHYSTLAYSGEYYPMPTRNFYGGVEWKF